jgi:hypothetical protein
MLTGVWIDGHLTTSREQVAVGRLVHINLTNRATRVDVDVTVDRAADGIRCQGETRPVSGAGSAHNYETRRGVDSEIGNGGGTPR